MLNVNAITATANRPNKELMFMSLPPATPLLLRHGERVVPRVLILTSFVAALYVQNVSSSLQAGGSNAHDGGLSGIHDRAWGKILARNLTGLELLQYSPIGG